MFNLLAVPQMLKPALFITQLTREFNIDVSFYDELKNKFNASGDFALAYVIAHEVGHHVQKLMGIIKKLDVAKRRLSDTE